ncbi:tumor necrosis factor ligand superfamily member 9 [Leptodactylus fuscus]
MSPTVRSEDPENPQPSHPRCRLLDYCLVISLVVLTIMVGSLCTLYVAWERPKLGSIISEKIQMVQEGRNAQLVVENAELKNGTLKWSRSGVTSTFVGHSFELGEHELMVQKSGFYSITSQITLKCVASDQCEEDGFVSLSILKNIETDPLLKVNVHINKSTMETQPTSFSGSIRRLTKGDRIRAQLWTSHEIKDWQFDRELSVVGLTWMSDPSSVDFRGQ